MIRWLHISDLHLNNRNFSSDRLRDELPSFLRQEGLKCDYVFCTGDIRSANVTPNDFTDEMADYLNDICNAVDVSKDSIMDTKSQPFSRNTSSRITSISR